MKVESERIEYRRATVADVEVLVDYRVRFLNALYDHADDAETDAVRRSLRKYFGRALSAGDFVAWLAECDGRVIGTSGMVLWEFPARYGGTESGRAGYILNMYTIPEARRKGVCTQLLNRLIDEAKDKGLKYVHLHASKDGINIYRKAGFVESDQVELELRLK